MAELVRDPTELYWNNHNFEKGYTNPSDGHYRDLYLWDSLFAAHYIAEIGLPVTAATEFEAVMAGQLPNGMIPNTVFDGWSRKLDPERYSYLHPFRHTDYTQPPIMADAALAIYESFVQSGDESGGNEFLLQNYKKLKKSYDYFAAERQNRSNDPLVFNTHPHETGRDSDPTFDIAKLRLKRQGPETSRIRDILNTGLDFASVLAMNYFFRTMGWDTQKTSRYFAVNDVMFNCLYATNLLKMGGLARKLGEFDDAKEFEERGNQVQEAILKYMWFPDANEGKGAFYSLDNGKPIEEMSISNLFPLTLPKLHPKQLSSLLGTVLSSFNTEYPLASVATNSPNFDPHYREKRIWRGGTWLNMNFLLTNGLYMQADREDLADHSFDDEINTLISISNAIGSQVAEISQELVDKYGYWEFYDPLTGDPKRVKNFTWSILVKLLKIRSKVDLLRSD